MKAMVMTRVEEIGEGSAPLSLVDLPIPAIGSRDILIKVNVCGVCHTELDEIEGRTPPAELPRVLGHQAVGTVSSCGDQVSELVPGDRVGVAWIFSSCGHCEYCRSGDDNLCPDFKATGRDANGGYAEYLSVPAKFACKIPDNISSHHAAPMLCAGAIGYRSLRLSNLDDGEPIGMTGFGASAHLMMKMIKGLFPSSPVYVFARREEERDFALELGATWAGATDDIPPVALSAIIDTTPAWQPIVSAMSSLRPGGRLVINAIRKETQDQDVLQDLSYERDLWMEKEIKSVANVSRKDVKEFLFLASRLEIQPEIQEYDLEQANQALIDLKFAPVRGAKLLRIA